MSASLKESLRAYYEHTDAPVDEGEKARVVAMASREARGVSCGAVIDDMPSWRFLVGQLRFVSPLAWAAQVALIAAMLVIVAAFGESGSNVLFVMTAAVLSVAMAVPSVFKSFESDVAELEAACLHDSAQVLVCRLVLFGLADVLWMSIAAWLVPALAGGDPLRMFVYAATPFFAFCALCLHLSRRTRGRCTQACAAAAACVAASLWAANSVFPHWYGQASMVVWSLALAVSLGLAVCEARRLVSQVGAGGMARAPYLA